MSDQPYDPMSGPPPSVPGSGPGQPDQVPPPLPQQAGYPQGGGPGSYPSAGQPAQGGYPQGVATPSSYQSAPGSYPSAGQPAQGGYPQGVATPSSYQSAPGSYPSAGQPAQGGYPQGVATPGSYPPASTGSPSYPPAGQGGYPPDSAASGYPAQPGYPDAYGSQGYPTQAGYSGSGGYGTPPQPPTKGGGKGKLFAIIGGALALVLIAVVIAFVVFKPGGAGPGTTNPTETQQPETAQGAVKGYLEALAAGDAEKALSFAEDQPSTNALLTNAFLKASVEKAPITAIEVDEGIGSDDNTSVSATYRIGTKSISHNYTAKKIGDQWKLDQVVATGSRPNSWGSQPVTINGTLLEGDVITLFPGRYTVGLKHNYVGFANGTLSIDSPSTTIRPTNMTPTLNATGRQTIITQSRQLLTKCLSLKEMAPNGCGFAVRMPAGVNPVTSTIRWARTTAQDPFSSATPRLDPSDAGVATMTLAITVKVTVTGTDGRQYVGNSGISRAIATVTPQKIQVMFQR